MYLRTGVYSIKFPLPYCWSISPSKEKICHYETKDNKHNYYLEVIGLKSLTRSVKRGNYSNVTSQTSITTNKVRVFSLSTLANLKELRFWTKI